MDNSSRDTQLFSVDDITNMPSVSAAFLSPDGDIVACVITVSINNAYRDDITLIHLVTGEQKKIAEGSSPQWSPDSKSIAYIGDNNGIGAIFIYEVETGKSTHLVNVYESDYFIDHYANKNFCWSPDGKTIAYVSGASFTTNEEAESFRIFTDVLYKTKGGRGRQEHADKHNTHIWLAVVKDKTTRPVFVSEYNEHSISFSPDGKNICFVSNTSGTPDLNQWSDIFSVDIADESIQQVTEEKGSAFQPSWSPDGKHIAYLGISSEMSTNDSPAEDTQLYLVPASGGKALCLTTSLDRRIEQLSWDNSSAYIYFTAGNAGDTVLYRTALKPGHIEEVIHEKGKITEYSISSDDKKIIFIHTDSIHRGDVFIYDIKDQNKTQLTYFRDTLLSRRKLQPAETFWYTSFDNNKIQGWIIKPAHFEESKKYPLILVIHGGPHNMFGDEFEDRMQLLSANGYGVLFINPRGSSGYGQEFSYGTVRAWGEGDYEDLMIGVDMTIRQHSWVDPLRLGVTGQSYGGYMTNRIITKTKRFKAAVADGSISNLISFSGTSLYHSLMESEYQLSVYDNYDALWNCSPLKDVKNVSTPVLFLHGETDNEVPVSQAEEMYVALKKLGVKTALVQYVGEGHGWRPDLKPANRVDLLKRMINWFDQYLK